MTIPRPVRDVIIIGSGPAGYAAAIYTARAGLNPLLFEGSMAAGGALMNTTEVENYPGFTDGIMGPDLMDNMRSQALRFGADIITDDVETVSLCDYAKAAEYADIVHPDDIAHLFTDAEGEQYAAKTVILAMGSGYRKLGLPAEERLSGRGVSWCATCDGFFFKGKDIAVVGGGDSALEEATFLTRFANKVTLIHRRGELRGSHVMIERAMADPKLYFEWDSTISDLEGDKALTGIVLTDTTTGATRTLPASGLFVAIGHDPRSTIVKGQVELDKAGYVKVLGATSLTNMPGVFACGDLVDHTYRQAITAAGSGCKAALDAEKFLAGLGDANLPD